MRSASILLLAAGLVAGALLVPATPAGTVEATGGTPSFTLHVGPAGAADTAGEPSLGVNPHTGVALFQAFERTLRVTFDDTTTPPGATWTLVTPPNSVTNFDPILYTDKLTGRTFAGGLNGPCSILSYTDDDGATWIPVANACHGTIDHQRMASGPWAPSPPVGVVHPRAVHICAQAPGTTCATSLDGGLTFLPPVPVRGPCGGLSGHVRIGPDGVAYVPYKNCGGRLGLGVTVNNGLLWTSRVAPPSVPNAGWQDPSFDAAVGVTSGAPIYVAWQGTDRHPMVARSDDGGITYNNVTDVATTVSGLQVGTMVTLVGGDPDRAALAFIGSTTAGNPFAPGWTGTWDVYASFTYDGGASWETVKVTTDPLQRGWICAAGTTCNTHRNLFDFIDVTTDATGRVLVGFADGCIGACAGPSGTEAQSTSARGTIARQAGGLGLFAAYD